MALFHGEDPVVFEPSTRYALERGQAGRDDAKGHGVELTECRRRSASGPWRGRRIGLSCAALATKETRGKENGEGEKLVVKNRRATFDYTIEETYEGGLVLVGSEVKSMRAGKVDIVDAFATVEGGEMWLKQLYVAPFEQASAFPHEPRRSRKVLLHAREIIQMGKEIARGGYTLVPLRIYFKRGRVKVLLGLGKGKKTHDKRAELAAKDANREARAAMGRRVKGGDR